MEKCDSCSEKYEQVWTTSIYLWNKISEDNDFLCIKCFDILAKSKGIIIYWEGLDQGGK
jgi:hypothetical protein